MRRLSRGTVLDLVEVCHGRGPLEAGLSVLEAAWPEDERAADVPLGERDARLLDLLEAWYGGRLEAYAACPACGAGLEFALDVADVRARPAASGPFVWEAGGVAVTFRLPATGDLLRAAEDADLQAARRRLFEACVLECRRDGEAVDPGGLGPDEQGAVEAAMEALDPGGDVRARLACPACGHAFAALVEPAEFLRLRLEAEARAVLGEVDVLARAYGWSESEVLRLSDYRRQAYLALAGSVE